MGPSARELLFVHPVHPVMHSPLSVVRNREPKPCTQSALSQCANMAQQEFLLFLAESHAPHILGQGIFSMSFLYKSVTTQLFQFSQSGISGYFQID